MNFRTPASLAGTTSYEEQRYVLRQTSKSSRRVTKTTHDRLVTVTDEQATNTMPESELTPKFAPFLGMVGFSTLMRELLNVPFS